MPPAVSASACVLVLDAFGALDEGAGACWTPFDVSGRDGREFRYAL